MSNDEIERKFGKEMAEMFEVMRPGMWYPNLADYSTKIDRLVVAGMVEKRDSFIGIEYRRPRTTTGE